MVRGNGLPCTYEPCNKKAHTSGLCTGHYNQRRKGLELRPLQAYKRYPVPAPGKKICTSCERVKDAEEDFYRRSDGGGPQAKCKECAKKSIAEYNRRRAARQKAERGPVDE